MKKIFIITFLFIIGISTIGECKLKDKCKKGECYVEILPLPIEDTEYPSETNVVPEPCTIFLFGSGLIGLSKLKKKRLI